MKKYKLYQWLPLLLSLVIFISCNKKNYPDNTATEDKFEINKTVQSTKYTPAQIISISDKLAKTNKEGEMYYDDELGYRYWRSEDGKYYLDTKYGSGASPNKKLVKKRSKKHSKENEGDDYVHQ